MGRRRRAREYALQMLFQIDLTGCAPEEIFADFWGPRDVDPEQREFSEALVLGVYVSRHELDELIARAAQHWRLERMAVVDRNVLRMAVHEMVHEPRQPAAVVIDEAIEVAKKFGTEDSGRFINGILDAIRASVEHGAGTSPEA